MNQRQLANRWGVSEATLERWRSEGIGLKGLCVRRDAESKLYSSEREPVPDSPIIPVLNGSDEIVNQWVANDEGYLDILSHHAEFLTGRKPQSLESVLQEMIDANQ
jgi:hypothetical protein